MTASDSDRDIRITRVYDAPLALVWDAFTMDAHASQWWGPRGFTITTHHKDVRPGGTWDYTMHGPDGTDWPNFTRYLEVEPRALLVYDHGAASADAAPMFRVTARFRELDGRTELSLCMTFPTPEAGRDARVFIKAAGGNSTWDRLAEYLEKQASNEEVFVITCSVNAPIETVFAMFTTPERLAQWLPPSRVGTVFAGSHEHTARRPEALTVPDTLHTIVQLAEEGPSQTRITLTASVAAPATSEEVAAFVAERGDMTRGWTASFDTLEALLAG
jgi:uncharacterized protein YndB with AHSA1/START domain